MVLRHRLLDQLDAQPRPRLIVVQAPAGFGKTSLLRQHCERRVALGEKVAWVRMDSQSADETHFLHLLCDAARSLIEPAPSPRAPPPIQPATLQDLLRILAGVRDPVVLVVDNFESATAPEFEAVFAQVVRRLPESVQLCVGTRALPTAHLARLQIRDRTILVSNQELCFRPSETLDFLAEFTRLSRAEIAQIHERTEGWPAALQAFRLCMRRGAHFNVDTLGGKGITPELMDFLSAEMFDNLAPAQGSLLLELAVPDKLSAELVEHITGEPLGAERLAHIERAGLFLAQADLEGPWLRFHNLFRQFLLARAQRTYGDAGLKHRQQRVADWYFAHGLIEESIAHWIRGDDVVRAADAMATIVDALVAQERLGLIETLADQIPVDALLRHDHLVRGVAVAYGFRRAFAKAEALLHRHWQQLGGTGAEADAVGLHKFSWLFLLAGQDRIEELGAVAVEASRGLADHSGSPFAITLNARAVLCAGQGKYEQLRNLMLQARPLHDDAGSLFGRAYCDAIYSMGLAGQGRIVDSVRALQDVLRTTEQRSISGVSAGSAPAAYLVSNLYELDRIDDALPLIRDYAGLADQQTIVDAVAAMAITRARIAHRTGQRAEAEEALERLTYLGHRHSLDRLVIYAHAEFARQATLEAEFGRAEQWLMQIPAIYRDEPCDTLMFHSGETEACTVTWARWLTATGRAEKARRVLVGEIRRASAAGRRRRELKLRLMHALALSSEGKDKLAGRSLVEALEIGAAGGFVRSFLDEKGTLALLKQFKAEQADAGPAATADPVLVHLDRLLEAGGERSAMPAKAQRSSDPNPATSGLFDGLTKGEKKMLRFVATGLSNENIASRLSVTVHTVKWHLRNVFEKLHVRNRMQAILLARQHGLIK
jgi:LuxR family maltose regulon positive regulatory protein